MRAGLYFRVSSEEQVDGFSLDAQRQALTAYCRQKGWQVFDEYSDEGMSARTDRVDKRPAFKRMLEDVESGLLDVVAVHKLDRFSRNIRVTFDSLEVLARHKVGFVAVAQPDLDYTRPEGRMFMGMMATLAQYYSDNLSQETRKGKQERKRQGLYNGHIPFGMTKGENGVPIADPATIEGLRLAFDLAVEGRSDRDIAQALNEAGYRTTGARGRPNPFSKDTIRMVLLNRFYLGELPGERLEDAAPVQHAAVIPWEVWATAQEQRERRALPGRTTINRAATVYSLSSLCTCGHCGGRLQIQPNKGKPRLYCSSRRQTSGCTARSAFLHRHEEQIAQHLATFTIPADYRERLRLLANDGQTKPDDSTAQRKGLLGRLTRLKDLYLLGDLPKKDFLTQRERLQRELANLTAREDSAEERLTDLADLLADVARGWALATQEQRNRMARLLLEEIIVKNEQVATVKPRPELAGFFALDLAARQGQPRAGGSDGIRTRGHCLDSGAAGDHDGQDSAPPRALVLMPVGRPQRSRARRASRRARSRGYCVR